MHIGITPECGVPAGGVSVEEQYGLVREPPYQREVFRARRRPLGCHGIFESRAEHPYRVELPLYHYARVFLANGGLGLVEIEDHRVFLENLGLA